MNASRSVTTKTNGISLSADNNSLHEQLQKAVRKNLTLRLQCDTVKGKQVLYLRERSVSEFFRETWDRLVGKGEVAAAAKQAAWDAVHQQLNERIASARADHGKISAPMSIAATEEEGKAEAENDLWKQYSALKEATSAVMEATSAARGTAAAVYPHIMGIKPEQGRMIIISERLSIRVHSTATPRKPGAIPHLDDSLASAVSDNAPKTPMEKCIKELYQKQLTDAQAKLDAAQGEPDAAQAKVKLDAAQAESDAAQAKEARSSQFVHLDWQYRPNAAFRYGYSQEDWKEIHTNGLTQAIEGLTNEKKLTTPVVIDVDSNNASTVNELRETLELAEQDKSSAHHIEILNTLTKRSERNRR